MQELFVLVCYEVCIQVPTQPHALNRYNPSPPTTKRIRSDGNAVFIRVFNSTSRKVTPLHKQYTESMVPRESRGMTRNDVQISIRPYSPPPASVKGKRVSHARLPPGARLRVWLFWGMCVAILGRVCSSIGRVCGHFGARGYFGGVAT